MNCAEAEQKLSALLDDEISESDRLQIQEHLAACAACREQLEEWREYGSLLRASPVPESVDSTGAWAEIRERIEEERSSTRSSIPGGGNLVWTGAAAALLVFSTGVYFWISNRTDEQEIEYGITSVEYVETEIPDATPVVYVDSETGLTIIWIVEPDDAEGRDI